ncbi:MAG TPA: insulinase family protein [Bacteroidetes bacterium]|nr:insulinase family protein [Bacteroidota bacterium]
MGARLSTNAGTESSKVQGYFSVRQQDKIWDIIQQVVLYPTFDAAEFEKGKKRSLAGLKQAKESPRSVIGTYWDRFIYGDHPYGNPVNGDTKGIESLSPDDLRKFYRENYTPDRAAIAVVGDFKISEMKSRLNKLFKGWKKAKRKKQPALASPQLDFAESRVLLVNKDDSRETRFYIGGKGVPRSNPDYVGIQVVNTILGGRFTSWLNEELRINSGLSYGARSSFAVKRAAGTFQVSSFTKTSTTVEAIDLALEVLDRLHKAGPDAATLESAKNYLKGGFPTDYETSGQLAGLLSDFFIYGFDEAYINEFQQQVDALNLSKAKKIIAKYFPKEKLQFVLIGKGEVIRDKIRKYGVITELEITAPGF